MPANTIPKERAKIMMKAETKAKRRATLALVGLPLDDGEGNRDRQPANIYNLDPDDVELDF